MTTRCSWLKSRNNSSPHRMEFKDFRMVVTQGERWQNWSGSVKAQPRQVVKPGSINELKQRISVFARDGRHVRVVGSGHSFTPLAQSNDVLMSLDNLQGIISIDAERGVVNVLGGTKLKLLGETLLAS